MNACRKVLFGGMAAMMLLGLLLAGAGRAEARFNTKPNLVVTAAAVGNGSGGANDWELFVTIKNTNVIASTGGTFQVEFVHTLSGTVRSVTAPALGPGASTTVALQVSHCETHGVITLDSLRQIEESNETDNRVAFDYNC